MRSLFILAAAACLSTPCAAATYDIGPGQTYARIADAPWKTLKPGDTVAIHWQSNPYFEKLLISQSGTAQSHILITGVPGPNGELPIIDGTQASTAAQFRVSYRPLEDCALVLLSARPDQKWPTVVSYVDINGLELRGAYRESDTVPLTYSADDGTIRTYAWGAAGIYGNMIDHISITGCSIHDNGNGIFVSGNWDNTNILVQGCRIYGNSNIGRSREHNVYSEARGIIFDSNYFGPTRAGSGGANLKDRSAGTVVTNNWFQGGGRILDLVEPQGNAANAVPDPRFAVTTVQYNVIVDENGMANKLVHFGGDSGVLANYRPDLSFDHNTVVILRDRSDSWGVCLFEASSNAQSITATNNIVYGSNYTTGQPSSGFSWLYQYGLLSLDSNGTNQSLLNSWPGKALLGSVSGQSTCRIGDPQFVDLPNFDLHLQGSSPFVGLGAL